MLSKSAFNAMLKTLEEPPEHVKFILATTDPHKVPITVLSRCLQFVLRNMTTQQVAAHLAHVLESEQVPFEPAAVQLLGRAAMGSMRDALSLLDQAIAMGSGSVAEQDVRQMIGAVDKRYLYELLQYIVNQDGEALLEKAQEMAARAIGFDSALSELAMLLQRLALLKTVPAALADDPEHETLARLAQYLSGEQIQLYYQCAIHGKQDLSLAPDEYAGFVMTLLRMLAFAPMAAKAHSSEGIIEGTQLHNPQEDAAAKKPLILPDSPALPAVARPSENLAANEPLKPAAEDTSPWEAPPEAEVAMHAEAAISELEPATSATQTLSDEPTPVVAETEELPAEPLIEPVQAWAEASDMMPSESVGELADVVAADEFSAAEAVQEAVYFGDDEVDEEYADYPHLDAAPVLAALNESGDNSENEEEAEAEAPEFEPLPAFDGEHWAAMVRRLAPKLGAAQMVAQHAAWVRYDEPQQLLMLSLTDEARATSNKERLDKIRDTLSDAYGVALKLQTEPWRDDAGWETPLMRRKRLQQEGRRQAQMLLEADAAAQDILRLFDAQWLPDTLELAGQDEQ
jgi:DNA polymerase-3 subunit gamma/tau